MMHLLAVLLGAGLMLGSSLQLASGTDLGRGVVRSAHVRFILAGLLLTASPNAVPLLGEVFRAGSVHQDLAAVAAALSVAAAIGLALPHDPGDYRRLLYGTSRPSLPGAL